MLQPPPPTALLVSLAPLSPPPFFEGTVRSAAVQRRVTP
jgi:hypothetical protein